MNQGGRRHIRLCFRLQRRSIFSRQGGSYCNFVLRFRQLSGLNVGTEIELLQEEREGWTEMLLLVDMMGA